MGMFEVFCLATPSQIFIAVLITGGCVIRAAYAAGKEDGRKDA